MQRLATARILTVEDDPAVRADLRLILQDEGAEMCPDARDGLEAIDLAREHRPDLILIDLSVHRVDGVEATRRILSERDVPIVALSGHSMNDVVERAVEAGAVGHVLKPFSNEQLVSAISTVLSERAARDEWARRSNLIMIESMQRAGYAESEIAAAVQDSIDEDGKKAAPAARVGFRDRMRALAGR